MDIKTKTTFAHNSTLGVSFPKTCCFVLIPKKNPEIQNWVNSVSFNYYDRTITIKLYETDRLQTHDWILKSIAPDYNEDIKLIAFNDSGKELYMMEFIAAKAYSHQTSYDYSKTSSAMHIIELEYVDLVTYKLDAKKST